MPFQNEYVDKNTPIPMYYQLKEIILKEIREKQLKPGDMLPTEEEFCKIFDLSRTTVRQAMIELVGDGHLYRIKGKGTYIAKPKILQDFMRKLESYSEQMKRLNMTPKTEVLDIKRISATEEVSEALNINEGDDVVLLKRLRYANDDPIVVLDTYLTVACADILNIDMKKTGLYEFMSRSRNTKVIKVIRQIEAVAATKQESEALQIHAGYPIQLTTTIGFNEDEEPVEYSIAKYRGDKNKFIVELYT